jgi:hypothetical protein
VARIDLIQIRVHPWKIRVHPCSLIAQGECFHRMLEFPTITAILNPVETWTEERRHDGG